MSYVCSYILTCTAFHHSALKSPFYPPTLLDLVCATSHKPSLRVPGGYMYTYQEHGKNKLDEPPPPRDDHDDDITSTMTDEIDLGEDDEDGDCQYAPSSIGSPAPRCCMLDDEDDTLEILAVAADNAEDPYPICVYDPEWFDLPSDACPRILVFLVLSVPQVTGRGIAESNSLHVPSPALAPSPNGMSSSSLDVDLYRKRIRCVQMEAHESATIAVTN